jgi:hypothetical protein
MDNRMIFQLGYAAGIVFAIAFSGTYVLGAYVLSRIGKKFGVGSFGSYCVPFYNLILMCRWIGLSGWVSVWFFLPSIIQLAVWAVPELLYLRIPIALMYLAFFVYFWGTVARRLGRNFWLYGVTIALFVLPVLFLAFDDSQPPEPSRQSGRDNKSQSSVFLHCVSGELRSARLAIPANGLYIGRNPSKASLVLHSDQISNVHARVWPDSNGTGVWLEDWNSLNGTYYCTSANGERSRSKWNVLHGRTLLNDGARFRLGDKVAEFEVRGA